MKNEQYMEICLNIAKLHKGRTGANPSVGALLLQNNVAITGVTGIGGTPHAEVNAITKAKNLNINTNGATLFCTLEPCSHFGKNPPCVNAIIDAKIAKVFFAVQDPDSRVNGLGIKKLKESDIEVTHVYNNNIEEFYRPYFTFKQKKRPYICLKIASSLDGKIAISNDVSKWITNESARNYTNFLRSRFDGIIVGAKTAKKDNPQLNCRILGLENFSPKKFVVSNNKIDNYTNVSGSIEEILHKVYQNDIQQLLVEGGANLITQFIKADIFDEIHLIQSGIFLGNDARSSIENLYLNQIPLQQLVIKEQKKFDDNILTIFVKNF